MNYYSTFLLSGLFLVSSIYAQTSIPLSLSQPRGEISYHQDGPYFINDTVIVYLDDGEIYQLSTKPDAEPRRVDRRYGPLLHLAQSPSGEVYGVTGFDCDIGNVIAFITHLSFSEAGFVEPTLIAEFEPLPFEFGNFSPIGFDVTEDGIAWLADGRMFYTVDIAIDSIRQHDFDIPQDAAEKPVLKSFSEELAAYSHASNHLVLLNSSTGEVVTIRLNGQLFDFIWSGDDLLVLDQGQLRVFDSNGVASQQAIDLPGDSMRNLTFASTDLVLIETHDARLVRWNITSGQTNTDSYYPEVSGWQIATARVNSLADLAVKADDIGYPDPAADQFLPLSQQFVQIVRHGEDPTLMGPPLALEVTFEQQFVGGSPRVELEIRAKNITNTSIDEALIAGSLLFGTFCVDQINGGIIRSLAPGEQLVVEAENDEYLVDYGRTPRRNEIIRDIIKVYYSNGRPVPDGSEIFKNFTVSGVYDIIEANDVSLFPTVVDSELYISWADPRSQLLVVDNLGRLVLQQELYATDRSITFDASALSESMYRAMLVGEDGTSVHTFIVAR